MTSPRGFEARAAIVVTPPQIDDAFSRPRISREIRSSAIAVNRGLQRARRFCGGERTRTADFYVANVALYQLSYTPGALRG